MDNLEKIEEAINKIYGHLAITRERESELFAIGYAKGKEDGYKSGFNAGFSEGFEEGKQFPNVRDGA